VGSCVGRASWRRAIEREAAGGWRAIPDPVNAGSAEHEAIRFEHAVVRLIAAMALGGLIAIERKRRSKGLRTPMLISLASALFILLALEISAGKGEATDFLRVDPTQVMEAATAGVAFRAAGSIIRSEDEVKGLVAGAACGSRRRSDRPAAPASSAWRRSGRSSRPRCWRRSGCRSRIDAATPGR
jgi:hypothetical protein